MNIPERLVSLRKEQGITQKKLAVILDVAQPRIVEWEKGKRTPNKDSLVRLAEVFNVSVDYLIGESNVIITKTLATTLDQLSLEEQRQVVNFAQQLLEQKNQQSLD